jgi:hypothetical protein
MGACTILTGSMLLRFRPCLHHAKSELNLPGAGVRRRGLPPSIHPAFLFLFFFASWEHRDMGCPFRGADGTLELLRGPAADDDDW